MPVIKIGIYLAFGPLVDLRHEGLGRLLADFIKSAHERADIQLVIAIPRWMQNNLTLLFEDYGIRSDKVEIICPRQKPIAMVILDLLISSGQILQKILSPAFLVSLPLRVLPGRQQRMRIGWVRLGIMGILLSPLLLILSVVLLLMLSMKTIVSLCKRPIARSKDRLRTSLVNFLGRIPIALDAVASFRRAYLSYRKKKILSAKREDIEISLLQKTIARRDDVAVWYSPAAFWPKFNELSKPRLMCVPDVSPHDFPIGFALQNDERFLTTFCRIEHAISGGDHFITYSEDVKWRTLVKRYGIEPSRISVVPHGVSRLDDLVVVSGFPDNELATNTLCRNLFRAQVLRKVINPPHPAFLDSGEARFIFYASQFRPNKNIMSLLRAYNYLLRKRYIGFKLLLTGNPYTMPEMMNFIEEQRLHKDVICVQGLTAQELAACYRLADLAINPSFSEGGFPFTFSEAVSVGTPVVMARIAVTDEVIRASELRSAMLFDPYDWRDMARCIEWALENKDTLYLQQKAFYDGTLCRRDWRVVVGEYIDVLIRISSEAKATAERGTISECPAE